MLSFRKYLDSYNVFSVRMERSVEYPLLGWWVIKEKINGVDMLRLFYSSCLGLLLGCGAIADHLGQSADPSDTKEVVIDIPKGTTAGGLGRILEDEKVIHSADNFMNYVRITKEGGCLKAGKFRVTPAMDARTILETVCGVPLANDKPFTIVEGWRIREIDAALTKGGWIKAGEYTLLANDPSQFDTPFELPKENLEGYLYPETFMISPDKFASKKFIQRQLNMLADNFYTPNEAAIKSSGRTFDEIMIVASLLEREEPKPNNRDVVAGIIWKRLDNNWALGIDATSHYNLDDWNDRKGLLKNLKDTSDPYNTRILKGLPPTPIGSPSLPSLKAALNPESSKWWFYLHDKSQTFHGAVDSKGHEANRRRYNVY